MANNVLNLGGGQGFVEKLHTNVNGDGQHIIATEVNTDAVKDELLPLARQLSEDYAPEKDMYPVRIIPQHVMDRAFREGKFNDKAWWRAWANSEEGRLFGIERNGKVPKL